jgi:hypothetical protein
MNEEKKIKEAALKLANDIAWEIDPKNPKVQQFEKDYVDGKIEFKGIDAQIRESEKMSTTARVEMAATIINTPQHKDTNPTYGDFKDEMEGCIMCACDHGCNQWLARNAVKMLAIMEQLETMSEDIDEAAAIEVLDRMAQRPAIEYGKDLYEKMKREAIMEMRARKAREAKRKDDKNKED